MKLPRHAEIWLPGYVRSRIQGVFRDDAGGRAVRVWLTIADHYEPLWQGADEHLARRRVTRWRELWPQIAARHADSSGQTAKYTFFYPQEEYRPYLLEPLAEMARMGVADVEVHLHHDGEGEQDFIDRISGFIETLHGEHGLLRECDGKLAFGFIHGNWALDNSRPDGRWCGLNNEITLLRELGCYADFTMPSGASPTQARTVNTIYWATDDPCAPKSYDRGRPVAPGSAARGDLLMIPGPLGVRWRDRLLPRLETGEIAAHDPVTPYRVRRWLALAPRVGNRIFIKLYTHGAQEKNAAALLGGGLDKTFEMLKAECRRRHYELYFASAWGLRQAVEEALQSPAGPAEE